MGEKDKEIEKAFQECVRAILKLIQVTVHQAVEDQIGRITTSLEPIYYQEGLEHLEDYPIMLKPKDVSKIIGISMPRVYELFKRPDFPGVKISPRKFLVNRDRLLEWMETKTEVNKPAKPD